jgi:hypothetical protein
MPQYNVTITSKPWVSVELKNGKWKGVFYSNGVMKLNISDTIIKATDPDNWPNSSSVELKATLETQDDWAKIRISHGDGGSVTVTSDVSQVINFKDGISTNDEDFELPLA